MEAAVNDRCGNVGLCQWRSLSTEAAVGCREDDEIAFAVMASLANGGGINGSHHSQLCRRVIGVDGDSKDAIAAVAITTTAINRHFHQQQLLLPPSTTIIAATLHSMVNDGGSLC
jgi:hypothetical protein